MAVVEFINRPGKTYIGMRKTIDYAVNPKKTEPHLISGIGVDPQNAYDEVCAVKRIFGKTDKRLYIHFVQSFAPYDNVTPELAHEIALKTAEYYKGQYQIVIGTHTDKAHIHTHFVLNTVNIETGRKYTQNPKQLEEIQSLADKICEEYGLHTLSDEQKNTHRYKKPGEYRAEKAGRSWKSELKRTIDEVLSTATDRADFIRKMEAKGYQVKWTDTRENITFTTPSGMKCRDRKLGEPEYYNKHNFEMIFEQNAQFAENTEREETNSNAAIQSLSGLVDMLSDNDYQPVTDGFMLQNVEFDGMTWPEIQQTIGRMRLETEIRKSRGMANQNEQERKAAEQAFWQRMALLDEFEQWLYDQKFGQDNDCEPDYDDEDEWEM